MTDASTAALLDACIDALLAGEEWHKLIPADAEARAELLQLMQVAAGLHEAEGDLLPDPATSEAARQELASRGDWATDGDGERTAQ